MGFLDRFKRRRSSKTLAPKHDQPISMAEFDRKIEEIEEAKARAAARDQQRRAEITDDLPMAMAPTTPITTSATTEATATTNQAMPQTARTTQPEPRTNMPTFDTTPGTSIHALKQQAAAAQKAVADAMGIKDAAQIRAKLKLMLASGNVYYPACDISFGSVSKRPSSTTMFRVVEIVSSVDGKKYRYLDTIPEQSVRRLLEKEGLSAKREVVEPEPLTPEEALKVIEGKADPQKPVEQPSQIDLAIEAIKKRELITPRTWLIAREFKPASVVPRDLYDVGRKTFEELEF
ncbi:hypothetical protein [Sulfuriroseicoccus oceanibius]|uniref:Uncharacterized protein n=1 Tax=Sulfuriroseicoccus oceanibius TaxID=2707525 RepID=A0A7T7F046_9BACT|nr:hypothetical protein [Sulfuriroseicoccus oceanibius]QQL44234.1 hypothetical protein G3M56_010045 [Sulfuriroseicoccus oceanibius]